MVVVGQQKTEELVKIIPEITAPKLPPVARLAVAVVDEPGVGIAAGLLRFISGPNRPFNVDVRCSG